MKFVAILIAVVSLAWAQEAATQPGASVNLTQLATSVRPPQLFATQAAAQAHRPNDEIVWLNTASGIYHERGMRRYERVKRGAYLCRKEADAAGDRDTRNGQ